MPQHTIILKRKNRFAHQSGHRHVYINTAGVGLKHELHLCYRCDRFRPKSPDNCPMAQEAYRRRLEEQVDDVRVMCSQFVPLTSNSEFVRDDLKE